MPLKVDLLNPKLDDQRRCHKKKRLVQSPNSYFMDVKCPGCYKIKVYSRIIMNIFEFSTFLFRPSSLTPKSLLCVPDATWSSADQPVVRPV